jgi:hypothetical protein
MPAPVQSAEAPPVYIVTSKFNGRMAVPGFPKVFRLGSKQTFTGTLTPVIRNLVGARRLEAKRVKPVINAAVIAAQANAPAVSAPAVSAPAAPVASSVPDSPTRTSGRS